MLSVGEPLAPVGFGLSTWGSGGSWGSCGSRSFSCCWTLSGSLFGSTPGGRIFWRSFCCCGVWACGCCCYGAGAGAAVRSAALVCGASAGLQIDGASDPSGQTLGS